MLAPNESPAQQAARIAAYEEKFGKVNAAFRATIEPLVSTAPSLSLMNLADALKEFDVVTYKNGVIIDDL